jgi:hypothetical protein
MGRAFIFKLQAGPQQTFLMDKIHSEQGEDKDYQV